MCCTDYYRYNGSCVECPVGFYGTNCASKCTNGTYGKLCSSTCHCHKAECNYRTGCPTNMPKVLSTNFPLFSIAACIHNNSGGNCTPCTFPWYGNRCRKVCKCDSSACDSVRGCLNDTEGKTVPVMSTNYTQASINAPSIAIKFNIESSSKAEIIVIAIGSFIISIVLVILMWQILQKSIQFRHSAHLESSDKEGAYAEIKEMDFLQNITTSDNITTVENGHQDARITPSVHDHAIIIDTPTL